MNDQQRNHTLFEYIKKNVTEFHHSPGFDQTPDSALLSGGSLPRNCLIDTNPHNTAEEVRQNIHMISTSAGNKILVNFITDSVKRGKKHAEYQYEF